AKRNLRTLARKRAGQFGRPLSQHDQHTTAENHGQRRAKLFVSARYCQQDQGAIACRHTLGDAMETMRRFALEIPFFQKKNASGSRSAVGTNRIGSEMSHLIETEHLYRYYGKRCAVDDVSFTL